MCRKARAPTPHEPSFLITSGSIAHGSDGDVGRDILREFLRGLDARLMISTAPVLASGWASVIDAGGTTVTRAIGTTANLTSGKSDCVARAIALSSGTLVSLLFHGSVLATFLYLSDQKPGAIEQPTEAISLASLQSEVLEAVSVSQSAAAVSASSVDATVGEIQESAAAQPSEAKETETHHALHDIVPAEVDARESTTEPEGLNVVRGGLESERSAGKEMTALKENFEAGGSQHTVRDVREPRKPKMRANSRRNQEQRTELKQKGAASVRAKRGSQASAAQVSASSGSALNYAALVRSRVASRKPGGGGGRGTVVIAFSVSRSGALNAARISRSSGNSTLDGSVLAAVRSAGPFPPPPASANLNFAMPFYFK